MTFWSVHHLDLEDEVNKDIWARSAVLQADVRARHGSAAADVVQARVGGLPWVPDLVGRRWRDTGAVHVIGSAYSPFIDGSSARGRAMGLDLYRRSLTPAEFQRVFVRDVVVGDARYYEPLANLICGGVGDAERFNLTDLVRACFITADGGVGGDGAVAADPELFMEYARAGWSWTWRRFVESEATAIVALGTVAEHGLLKLLREQGSICACRGGPKSVSLPVSGLSLSTHPKSDFRHGCRAAGGGRPRAR